MPDIFISYSKHDEQFAALLYDHLENEGLNVFMASVSLEPGQKWGDEIIEQIKQAASVLFLASKAACASPCVQQEFGMALATDKNIIPIVWDIDPAELPGWMNRLQALNIRGASNNEIREWMSTIANKIKSKKTTNRLLAGLAAIAVGFIIYKAIK